MTDRSRLGTLVGLEPFLVLAAGPPLVLRELFPWPLQVAALAWLAGLWVLRRMATGSWSIRTALDLPIMALLATLPLAVAAGVARTAQPLRPLADSMVLAGARAGAPWSRAESLLFAVALYYAMANAVDTPRRAWWALMGLMGAGLGLAAVGLVGASWQVKLPILTPLAQKLPHWLATIPHPTLSAGVHPNTIAALLILPLALAAVCLAGPRRAASGVAPGADRGRADPVNEAALGPETIVAEAVSSEPLIVGAAGSKPLPTEPVGSKPLPTEPVPHLRPDRTLAPPRLLRPVALLTLALGVPILLLSQSRGAWIALAGALLIAPFTRLRPRWRLAVVSTVALAGVLAAGFIMVGADFEGTGNLRLTDALKLLGSGGHLGRPDIWLQSLDLVAAHPLTGIGLNTFPLVFGQLPEFGGYFVYRGFAHAHNTLLQAALDYGLPGMTAVAGLFAAAAWAAYRARRRLAGTALEAAVMGVALALAAYALHGLVDTIAIGAKPGFYIWAYAGVLAALRARAHQWHAAGDRGNRAGGRMTL